MSLLRTSTSLLSRATRAPVATMTMAPRGYADGPGGRTEGSTASSKGWKEKEQAQENQYFREAEKEKLQKLRESIAKQREHFDEVERNINEFDKK